MANGLLEKISGPADLKKLSIEQLSDLAQELREAICKQVSTSGGHLAPNLGVVELTIALHYVFDFAHDRLLFDVGHQCYTHKLLTGRQPLLSKLRQKNGMAGFPEPRESHYDLFSVGHAGTSVATGVGMARADSLMGQGDRCVVSLVGDSSIVNGVSLEGLNNAGTLNRQFLVVLNDNGMSIAKPEGAVSKYLDQVRVNKAFGDLKKNTKRLLSEIPMGNQLERLYERAGGAIRGALHPHHLFSEFGLVCVGPMDGHDLPALIQMFEQAKNFDRPLLIHCKTIKGKGFDFSTKDPTTFHSPSPFEVERGKVEWKKKGRSFTAAFGDALTSTMQKDERVVAVTAAMPDGTGLSKVSPHFPKRVFDTGLCESHAMDMCAGMAKVGIKPFFAVYSTFVQRALDQVFQEVALQSLPVRVCLDRAGYVGSDGAVHHGFMDLNLFKPFPGIVMLAPSDEPNLIAALEFMRMYDSGASFMRYPRDEVPSHPISEDVPPFQLGKAHLVRRASSEKPDLAILAYGTEVYEALKALQNMGSEASNVALYDARFAKPIDVDLVTRLVRSETPILTIEENMVSGGFGSSVLEALNSRNLPTNSVHLMGMPERWVYQNSRAGQLAEVGLDAAGIEQKVRSLMVQIQRPRRKQVKRDFRVIEAQS